MTERHKLSRLGGAALLEPSGAFTLRRGPDYGLAQTIVPSVANPPGTLPDARTLKLGGPQFLLDCPGENGCTVRNADGDDVIEIAAGDGAVLALADNSTAAGRWVACARTIPAFVPWPQWVIQPGNVREGEVFEVQFARFVDGVLDTSFTGDVTVALTSPGSSTLNGTLTVAAVAGVATFDDLSIDYFGAHTLTASIDGDPDSESDSFVVSFDYDACFGAAAVYDFFDIAGLTLSSDRVISWAGGKGVVTGTDMGSSGNRPQYLASGNIGSAPVVKWDTTARLLDFPFPANLAQPHVLLWIGYLPTLVNGNHVVSNKFGASDKFKVFFAGTSGSVVFAVRDGTAAVLIADAAANWPGSPHTLIGVVNGASSKVYRRGGSNLVASGALDGTETWGGFQIGSGVFGGTVPDDTEVAGLAILKALPTADQLDHWLDAVEAAAAVGGFGCGIPYTGVS